MKWLRKLFGILPPEEANDKYQRDVLAERLRLARAENTKAQCDLLVSVIQAPSRGRRWVVCDRSTGVEMYFAVRPQNSGWYSYCLMDARFYKTESAARRVVNKAGHHVTYLARRPEVKALP